MPRRSSWVTPAATAAAVQAPAEVPSRRERYRGGYALLLMSAVAARFARGGHEIRKNKRHVFLMALVFFESHVHPVPARRAGGGGHAVVVSALSRSSMRSCTSSMPTESRTRSFDTPASSCCSSLSCWCVVEAG